MRRKRANRPEILAVNNLSRSLTKLQNMVSNVWSHIHTSADALSVTKHLDSLSEVIEEVQDRIDDVKELHNINVRERTLGLTKKFRSDYGIPETIPQSPLKTTVKAEG